MLLQLAWDPVPKGAGVPITPNKDNYLASELLHTDGRPAPKHPGMQAVPGRPSVTTWFGINLFGRGRSRPPRAGVQASAPVCQCPTTGGTAKGPFPELGGTPTLIPD